MEGGAADQFQRSAAQRRHQAARPGAGRVIPSSSHPLRPLRVLCVSAVSSLKSPNVKSSLFQRVASSIVGFPILVFSVFWHGGLPFMLAVGVLCLTGMREFFQGCRKGGYQPIEPAGYLAALLFLIAAHRQGGQLLGTHLPAAL